MATSIFAKLHRRFGHPIARSDLVDAARQKIKTLNAQALPSQEVTLLESERAVFESGSSVAVVGGGFAGLSAAYYLAREGAQVTLFEPREEVGGRVLSLQGSFTPDRIVEAGAELIGLNHSMWLELAQRFGLSLSVLTPESDYSGAGLHQLLWVDVKGIRTQLDAKLQEKVFDEIEALYVGWNREAADVDAESPWNSPASVPVKALDSNSVEDWIKKANLSQEAESVLKFDLGNDQTIPVAEQSFLGLLAAIKGGATSLDLAHLATPSEYWTETEVFRCAHGNQELAKKLREEVEKLCGRDAVRHVAVSEIDLLQDPANVRVKAGNLGSQFFDWVVVAVPPSVYDGIKFIGLNIARAAMRYGDATKYLSRVNRRFWIQNNAAPSGADDKLGAFWEATDNQIAFKQLEFTLSIFRGGRELCRNHSISPDNKNRIGR